MGYLIDFLTNLAANVAFWSGLGGVVWIFYALPIRRRFDHFFGLQVERTITIYLSNLWLPSMASRPWGEIVAKKELDGASVVKSIFASASPGFPELVRGLVDNIWTRNKYNIEIEVSPQAYAFPSRNMIVIGASTKNSVRRYFLDKDALLVTIQGEPTSPPTTLDTNPLSPILIVHRTTGDEAHNLADGIKPAIVERFYIKNPEGDNTRVVIMCAGITGTESRLATEYLAQHWRELETEAKTVHRFARCLAFNNVGTLVHYFDCCE